jgi:prefoldin subunit 5
MWKPSAVLAMTLMLTGQAVAQDVPGIEICTAEKTMERRTSCLQSNVNFLMRTIAKLTQDNQHKLDAANRQIDALKASVVSLQAKVGELQAAKAAPHPAKSNDKPKEPAAK